MARELPKEMFDKIADALIVQHPRIHTKAITGKGRPKGGKPSGKGGGTRPSKGRSKGEGGKSRHWRNPAGFAFHAAEERVAAMDDSCGFTAEEPYANHAYDDEDYSDDCADAYNAYDEEECEDSFPGYDAHYDWNGESMEAYVAEEWNKKWSVEDPIEASELETVAYLVSTSGEECTQDPELCSDIIQAHSAYEPKVARAKARVTSQENIQFVLLVLR